MWKIVIVIASSAIASTNAATITCWTSSGPSPQSCMIANITNVASPDENVTVSGFPTTFVDSVQTGIWFDQYSPIDYFPRKIFNIFPNAMSIGLNNCSLPNLVTNTFGSCGSLQNINGMYLKAQTLPSGFAQNCANLTSFGLNFGELSTLDPNALQGLTSLQYLMLSDNKITCIPPGFFTPAINLMSIMMDRNQITALDANLFAGLSKLSWIGLSQNKLTYVPTFNNMTSTTYVMVFMVNNITAIDPNMLPSAFQSPNVNARFEFSSSSDGWNSVTCFQANNFLVESMTYQQLKDTFGPCYANWTPAMANTPVPCAVTTTTSTTTTTRVPGVCPSDGICRFYLDYADRYTCVLDGVDGTLTSISGTHISPLFTDANVTRVYFTHSFLSRVPPAVFTKFPSVEFLSVANCSLGMFTNSTMPVCGALKYLDARFNEIFHVSDGAFKSCASLQTVDFTGNPIDVLNTAVFALDPSLKRVILNQDASGTF